MGPLLVSASSVQFFPSLILLQPPWLPLCSRTSQAQTCLRAFTLVAPSACVTLLSDKCTTHTQHYVRSLLKCGLLSEVFLWCPMRPQRLPQPNSSFSFILLHSIDPHLIQHKFYLSCLLSLPLIKIRVTYRSYMLLAVLFTVLVPVPRLVTSTISPFF